MKSDFSKTLSLFQKNAFPLHHTFVRMLERYSTSTEKFLIWQDIKDVSELLGDNYCQFSESFKNSELKEFFTVGLSIKVAVKKRKALTGSELQEDVEQPSIEGIITRYSNLFEHEAELIRLKKEAEEQAEIARRNQAVEARFARMREEEALRRQQYEKEYIDFPDWNMNRIKRSSRAAKILQRLLREAISEQDYLWLTDKDFGNVRIEEAFYQQRARQHLTHWKNDKKPWSLVNAIADFRKGENVQEVMPEIEKQLPFKFVNGNNKLQSALFTTSGGAYRDQQNYSTAIKLGEQAHALTPDNYRPCTLLGAAHILSHDTVAGYAWYQKAIERGFKEERVDDELKSIYFRSDAANKQRLKADLKKQGYSASWLK